MEKVVTYSLCNGEENSDRYYEEVLRFTDKVIVEINDYTTVLVKDFKEFILKNNIEDLRSDLEYSLELLILGVFWDCYINKAMALKKAPKVILTKLSKLRDKNTIKKPVDFSRGILGTAFLNKEKNINVEITLDSFVKLINWLRATGEFNHEIKRLKIWEKFLYTKSESEIKDIILEVLKLEQWFKEKSNEALGKYTKGVAKFHESDYKEHKWKEDYIFCGRKGVEYHLNMVGAEILNRAYREDFLKTKKRLLLLPACMRLSFNSCKAVETESGYICAGCSESCKINQYSKLGERNNFKVSIIHHQSNAFKGREIEKDSIGIIGVTCVLNLIAGGLNAKDLGFVPQCVLLDYCGCREHWHKEGISTNINIDKFFKINV